MGSYSYTCAVSNLPISAGDEVRYLLLTENPYGDKGSRACYPYDTWVPRTFPIRAKYNDYGTIDCYTEGLGTNNILDGLQLDLVVKGWGDNTCHDVPVDRSIKFPDLLEAIREGRVSVKEYDVYTDKRTSDALAEADSALADIYEQLMAPPKAPAPPKGVPTRKRIERVVAGLPPWAISDRVTVNRLRLGSYRVRGPSEIMKTLATALDAEGYSAALIAGANEWDVELRVDPKPGIKGWYRPSRERINRGEHIKRELAVHQAMIREDVWQALLKLPNETSLSAFRTTVQIAYDRLLKHEAAFKRNPALAFLTRAGAGLSDQMSTPGLSVLTRDPVPCVVGLSTHFQLLVTRCLKNADDLENLENSLDTIAEMLYLLDVSYDIRHSWRPSNSCGPQLGDFTCHANWHKALTEICQAKEKE